MGLDITVVIADRSWLARVPPRERLPRLRNAWYADAPAGDEGWAWPQGRDSSVFAVYEFPDTLGSFKPHFWAGHRWEPVRDHVAPSLRTELDALLSALVWDGPDGEAEHTDTGFFGEEAAAWCSRGRRRACGSWPRPGTARALISTSCMGRSPSMPQFPTAGFLTSTRSRIC
ncbi:hypothetical protein ACFQV4_08625 [Streptomyces thermocarboxydus]